VDVPVKAAAKRLGGVPEEQILLAWAKAKGAVVLTYVFFYRYLITWVG
jgi:hypothetical protein